jgi:hypothetical protein
MYYCFTPKFSIGGGKFGSAATWKYVYSLGRTGILGIFQQLNVKPQQS